MITTENTYFLRIILLLYDAASFILRHIVVRELKKQNYDIDNLLKKDEFENKLKHKLHFGKSQVEKLFPSNGKSDIQTWDSQMLAVVSLLIFRSTLSSDEKYHIKFLQLTRNNVAHKPSASCFEDDFVDEKERIINAITILASGFDSTVQEKCGKLISSYCSDPLDTHVQLAIKHLEDDTTNNELLRQILDAVNNKHEIVLKDIQDHAEKIENKLHLTEKKICGSQETVLKGLNGLCLDVGNVESKVTESKKKSSQELKIVNSSLTNHIVNEAEKVSQKVDSNNSLLREVQRNQNEHAAKLESKLEEIKQQISRTGGHCTKQIKFGTHTHLTVDGPTQEWINTVETVLKNVFDILLNNVQEPGQNPETERAVKEFLNYIKGFKGVELKSVERKCILLAFECLTYDSLRELIEFINSNGFLSYLESIARALQKDLKIPQKLVISSEIPVSSLQLLFDDKSSSIKPESKKGISLSFECTSIDGLDAFWRLFVKGEATPYIDKVAATVSSEMGEKTSLSTSVNLQEFEDALTHLEATVNIEKETEILKTKSESKQRYSDSKSVDSDLDIDKVETRTGTEKEKKLLKPNRQTTRQSSDLELDIDTIQTRKDLWAFRAYGLAAVTETEKQMARGFELSKGCDFYESISAMASRNADSSEQIFDDIVNLSKENPKRVVILLVGKSGAGKSAFINTFYKAITGESHKIAKVGNRNTTSVTPTLVWYEHCGVKSLGLIKDEHRRNALSECLENLPNIIDFAGLGDVDDEYTRVILDRLFDGCIEPGTEVGGLQDLQKLHGHDCLSRNRTPERVVTHLLFVQSWRDPVPVKLIECLANVMGTLNKEGSRKYPVAKTVLITRYDELVYPTQRTGNQPNNEKDYEKCKDKIAETFCFVKARADNIIDWINYSDSIKADGRYPDNRNDVIDYNALKLLRRFLEPGVPVQHLIRSLVDWRMRLKIQANKIRHFGMEWIMAVVVLCLLLLFFLLQAINSINLDRDKVNSNNTGT